MNETLHISPKGLDLLMHYEGCKLTAYQDAANKWTIGWGNTFYEDGKSVKQGDSISLERAKTLLRLIVPKFESLVRSKLKRSVLQHEFDAAVVFCYNAGASYKSGAIWKDYNIWSNINKHLSGDEMFNYWSTLAITSGGAMLNGLVARRKSEVTLYLHDKVVWFN